MKIGNYVRVAIDNEKYKRDFVIAKVTSQDDNFALVELVDNDSLCDIYELPEKMQVKLSSLIRARANIDSTVRYNKKKMIVLEITDDNGYFQYLLTDESEFYEVYESELEIEFNNLFISPVQQYINYEFHNPVFYINRLKPNEIALRLKHSKSGFKELFGSRVYLMKHQMDTILKAQNIEKIRLMLADEVGLGKTVQALSILKAYVNKFQHAKVLILVPEHLKQQWEQEIYNKFWLSVNKSTNETGIVLLSVEDYFRYENGVRDIQYDFVIIDEIHNYIKGFYYRELESLSLGVDNLLLLSATPIQKRVVEFKNLVTLLDPERFRKLSLECFEDLLTKQDRIRKSVYTIMRDLSEYVDDVFIQEDIESEVKTLIMILDDSILRELYSDLLSEGDSKKRLLILKRILSYTSNYYQIERRVIRHRKSDLIGSFAKREVNMFSITYEGNLSYYEDITLQAIEKYAEFLLKNNKDNFEFIKKLYSSFTSSPYALRESLDRYSFPYDESLKNIITVLNLWEIEVDVQLDNIKDVILDPDLINNRISYLIDYLDQNIYKNAKGYYEGDKVLLITNFSVTAHKILNVLRDLYDKEIFTGFTENMNINEKNEAIQKFQENDSCKILIADKSAGEGKNLQAAKSIIHFDLTWSPADIEQRIGRLDRIGRDSNRSVNSVVFYKPNCIEEDLIQLWSTTFKVYEKSISGLEISISDIEDILQNEITNDLLDGVKNASEKVDKFVSDMYEYVEEERYYDMAKTLDPVSEREYDEIFKQFSGKNEESLIHSMQNWSAAIGLRASNVINEGMIFEYERSDFIRNIGSLRKVLLPLPNTKLHLEHTKSENVLRGTFDRDLAVKNESLAFFSPGESFFDTVFQNAKGNYKGRTSAVLIHKEFEWTGLKIDWVLNYDYTKLYNNGVRYMTIKRFMNLIRKPVISVGYDLEGKISIEMYKDLIKEMSNSSIIDVRKKYHHIGSRSSHRAYKHPDYSDLEVFIARHPQNTMVIELKNIIRSIEKKLKGKLDNYINIEAAISDIDEKIIALENSKQYFGLSIEESEVEALKTMKSLLMEDLPVKLSIDSIMYIEVVKDDI